MPASDTGKFTLQLKTSSGTLLANFLNGGNGAVMGPVTVPAGNYVVSEVAGIGTNLANYTSVISGAGCGSNGAVTVAAGDNKVCTITNTRVPSGTGTVTLKKILVPASDTGKFTLQLKTSSGTLLANFLNGGNGAVMGPVTVPAGNYVVSEVAGIGTNLANYTSVISGAGCGSNGAVTVAAGDNKICTITNTRNTQACTGWPLTADVYIYAPGQPFGPQTVDICRSGHIVFHNANSGAAWTILPISGPTNFAPVPLPTNGSFGSTIPFPVVGVEEYQINGSPSFVVHGHIHIH